MRAGDPSALTALYRRHAPDALRYARRIALSASDAEDIVAEAFTKTMRAISNGLGPLDGFRMYLFTAVRRTAERFRRDKEATAYGLDLDEVIEGPDPTVDDPELDPMSPVCIALGRLPERWQRVLWLLEVEGYTIAEVAAAIHLSRNATSALAYRARQRLRTEVMALVTGTDDPTPARQ